MRGEDGGGGGWRGRGVGGEVWGWEERQGEEEMEGEEIEGENEEIEGENEEKRSRDESDYILLLVAAEALSRNVLAQ